MSIPNLGYVINPGFNYGNYGTYGLNSMKIWSTTYIVTWIDDIPSRGSQRRFLGNTFICNQHVSRMELSPTNNMGTGRCSSSCSEHTKPGGLHPETGKNPMFLTSASTIFLMVTKNQFRTMQLNSQDGVSIHDLTSSQNPCGLV